MLTKKGLKNSYSLQHNAISIHNGVRIRCPCVNCLNGRILSVSEIREHLLCDGFLKNYTT